MKKTLLGLSSMLAAATALFGATPSAHAEDLWCTTTVTQVVQWTDGRLSVVGPNFAYDSDKSVILCDRGTNAEYCDAMLSISEAALLSGRSIIVKLDVPANTTCKAVPMTPVIKYVSAK